MPKVSMGIQKPVARGPWPLLLLGLCACGDAAPQATVAVANAQIRTVVEGALAQVGRTVSYVPAYRQLAYPGGDVPLAGGVCTDVLIRALRGIDMDLQVLVHEAMRKDFPHYPQSWGLKKPDPNIDHRRVPNLETFFTRQGNAVPVTDRADDYLPGDVVSWRLANGLPHIGLVSHRLGQAGRLLVVHNIGAGAQLEDILFAYRIHGHYRLFR